MPHYVRRNGRRRHDGGIGTRLAAARTTERMSRLRVAVQGGAGAGPMLATCVVCCDDQKPCTASSGCGHVVACADCAARIVGDNPSGKGRCPVCRVVSIPVSLYF